MSHARADLILHPIRMRILVEISNTRMTAQQLVRLLPDVPQATLYRHLNTLLKASILQVVEERPVRGTLEKVYALHQQQARLGPDELAAMSKDDHMRYFTAYITSLLADFARYLDSGEQIDLVRDGVIYSKATFYLNDDEYQTLLARMTEAILPVINNQPAAGRRRRLIANIFMPSTGDPAQQDDQNTIEDK